VFTTTAVIALGLALSWRSADQAHLEEGRKANCEAIKFVSDALADVVQARLDGGVDEEPVRLQFERTVRSLRTAKC